MVKKKVVIMARAHNIFINVAFSSKKPLQLLVVYWVLVFNLFGENGEYDYRNQHDRGAD